MTNCYIGKKVKIGKNVLIGNNVTLYGDCQVSDNCIIGDNVTIGFPCKDEIANFKSKSSRGSLEDIDSLSKKHTYLGEKVKVLSNSVLYSGVRIDKNTEVLEHTRIGTGTSIGERCKVRYGAQIYTDVTIGSNSIIAGFCCSRAKIGSNCTMMGNIVHKYDRGWIDGLKEAAPIIDDYVVVGYNALLIGAIKISRYVYIAAGALVTKNVPSNSVVIGSCRIHDSHQWKGGLDWQAVFKSREGNHDGCF